MAANPSVNHQHDHDGRPRLATAPGAAPPAAAPRGLRADARPMLLFFTNKRSGVARRMSSLVAWVSVTEKARLRVIEVDVDESTEFTRALEVTTVPTLLVVRER